MKINFFLADEFRPEIAGKQTVLGLYADNTILLEHQAQLETPELKLPSGIDRLAFLVNISDAPEGLHSLKAQIIGPSGIPHGPEVPFGESEILKGTSRAIILEAKPFLIQEKGTYHFNFYVDDILYSFPFSIIDRAQGQPSVS